MGAALVAVVAVATYARALAFGFIYDDYWTVVSNTHLDKSYRELVAAALSGRGVEWNMPDATRPLMGLSLWWDRRLFGLSPSGYHLHSLGLYALACVLVFLLAFGLLRRFLPALCAGLIFAVLPIHVEVAAVVNYREDLLAAVGMLGALTLSFWPTRSPWRWRSVACGLLWGYALFAKESALIAPALVAALAIARRPSFSRAGVALPPSVVCGGVAALWLNWRFGVSRLGEQIPTASYASWSERLLRTARFEVIAAWKSFAPIAPRPEREPLGDANVAWLLALILLIAALVWMARRRSTRLLAAAGAVALVAPLCTSPLLAPLNEVADRYWFIGSLAAALGVGWIMTSLPRRAGASVRALLVVGCAVASCAVASWKASSVWASEIDLWSFVVQTAPGSARAWTAVSRAHRLAEQEELANRTIERALALKPQHVPAHAARVLNSLWFGKLDAARAQLRMVENREMHGDSLRAARRCATAATAESAQACARRTVPSGLILGDPERLRAVSEHMLAEPLAARGVKPFERAGAADAGADAGASVDPVDPDNRP
jgi:protein O-mannosyl-transferase